MKGHARYKHLQTLSFFTFIAGMISLASGCADGAANRDSSVRLSQTSAVTNSDSSTSSGSSSSGSGSATTTTTAPITKTISGTGYTSTTVTVSARARLKVKFTPASQTFTYYGREYQAYSALGVYISVNGTTQKTSLLSTGVLTGSTASSSSVFDFSGNLVTACGSSDTTCRDTVTITVSNPNSDYYCIYYGSYCPWTRVPEGSPWSGTLTIETDDTSSL